MTKQWCVQIVYERLWRSLPCPSLAIQIFLEGSPEKSNLQVIVQGNEVGLSFHHVAACGSFGHLSMIAIHWQKNTTEMSRQAWIRCLWEFYFDRMTLNTEPRIRWNLVADDLLKIDQLCGLSRNTLPLGRIKRYFILWLPKGELWHLYKSLSMATFGSSKPCFSLSWIASASSRDYFWFGSFSSFKINDRPRGSL